MSQPTEPPGRNSGNIEPRSYAARIAAVQVLYEIDMVGTPADTVLADFLERRAVAKREDDAEEGRAETSGDEGDEEPRPALLSELVQGAQENLGELDGMIEGLLKSDRGLQRLDVVLRAILRVAAYELLARPQVPARVVISEYCDIAGAFFDDPQEAVANAVLDRLARQLRGEEFPNAAPTTQ